MRRLLTRTGVALLEAVAVIAGERWLAAEGRRRRLAVDLRDAS